MLAYSTTSFMCAAAAANHRPHLREPYCDDCRPEVPVNAYIGMQVDNDLWHRAHIAEPGL